MYKPWRFWIALAAAGCASPTPQVSAPVGNGPGAVPRYTAEGELLRPDGFERWTFVGASIGLSYADGAPKDEPGVLHNVFVQPESFDAYLGTGRFPEKTVFALALHEPRQRESINKQGYFEGDLVALEVAVKDAGRFKEGWAYFDFGKGGLDSSARAKPAKACHSCHVEHGADDNVFVQFYPPLRAALAAKNVEKSGAR